MELTIIKKKYILPIVVASIGLAGCGADSGTTAEQEAAFKSGAKPTVTIPPGANTPPPNFKSSLDNGGPRMPANGTPGPGTAGG